MKTQTKINGKNQLRWPTELTPHWWHVSYKRDTAIACLRGLVYVLVASYSVHLLKSLS